MSYGELVGRTWKENLLFSVLVELTYRCNLDCYFCYNDLALQGTALALADYERLLADLAELETLHLILTGGEPLAHPHFFSIGGRARELGFVVRIKSNGHALRGAIARRVREEIDPFLLEVSLHGAAAATHDRQTRVAGSFERLLANLEECLALGLRIKLNSTLTRWNEAEMEGMYALADRLGVPLQFDPEVTPRDDGDRGPLSITASPPAIRRLFELQRERAERRSPSGPPVLEAVREGDQVPALASPGKHCGAGSSALAIDPFGNVYPCVQWRRAVGNLHQRSIRDIWLGDAGGLAEVRAGTEAARALVAGFGPEGRRMAFCPGLAVAETGRPDALYDGARERLALVREERRLLPVVD